MSVGCAELTGSFPGHDGQEVSLQSALGIFVVGHVWRRRYDQFG